MSSAYNFDASQVAPSTGAAASLPVSPPEGWLVQIIEAENKPTAAGDGSWFVEFILQIMEGEHSGSTGAYRLNLGNQNEQAVNIAHAQLSAICHVVGIMQVQDLVQLANIPFRAIVVMQKGPEAIEKGYTEVKAVLDVNGNKPGKGGPAAPNPGAAPSGAPQFQPSAAAPPPTASPQFAIEQGQPASPTSPPVAATIAQPTTPPVAVGWPSSQEATETLAAPPAESSPAVAPAPAPVLPVAAPAPATAPPAAAGKAPWLK